jgi:hypothetical protein
MHRVLFLAIFFSLVSNAFGSPVDETLPPWITSNGPQWIPPDGGVVRDPKAAITIAHAIWISLHPNLLSRAGSDEDWQRVMGATLRQGVWEVAAKERDHSVGGGLFIYVAQKDGRILSIAITQ